MGLNPSELKRCDKFVRTKKNTSEGKRRFGGACM